MRKLLLILAAVAVLASGCILGVPRSNPPEPGSYQAVGAECAIYRDISIFVDWEFCEVYPGETYIKNGNTLPLGGKYLSRLVGLANPDINGPAGQGTPWREWVPSTQTWKNLPMRVFVTTGSKGGAYNPEFAGDPALGNYQLYSRVWADGAFLYYVPDWYEGANQHPYYFVGCLPDFPNCDSNRSPEDPDEFPPPA